jgi:hypothetical protein
VSIVASGMARPQPDSLGSQGRHERAPTVDTQSGQDFRNRLSEAIGGYGQPDAAPAQNTLRRDTWQAAGNVVIRDGHAAPDIHPADQRPHGGNGRSMPAVGDFPPVAQREYWAKASDVARPASHARDVYAQQADVPRRPGLLQRLTGVGRDKRSEANRDERSSARAANGADTRRDEEQVDLPVFFGRGRRS